VRRRAQLLSAWSTPERVVVHLLASESQNLLPVLETIRAVYRGAPGQLPAAGRDGLAQRAAGLASGVRFGMDDPEALRRLQELARDLRDVSRLDELLPRILDGALSLTGADLGNIRLIDPVSGSLWLVTQSGFGPEFLDHFAVVPDDPSAYRWVPQGAAQIVIADADDNADFGHYRDIAAAAGFRAFLSTPLLNHAGRLIGVVSTFFAQSYRPPARDLQMMALYGEFAGQAVAGHLGVVAGDGLVEMISRAVISALLYPEDRQEPGMAALSVAGGRAGGAVPRPASADDTMSRSAGHVVNRLFSVGLSLESARSIVGDGPAGHRIAVATGEIDGVIRDIRMIALGNAVGPGHRAADRRPPQAGGVDDRIGEPRPAGSTADRAATRERLAQAARALQATAADTAVLLERSADPAQPGRIDYPTEIKRWRAFAEQADQIVKRLEQMD
jgi:GAF domain